MCVRENLIKRVLYRCRKRHRSNWLRLETVYPAARHGDVLAALRLAHPYEEPAFDVYELVE